MAKIEVYGKVSQVTNEGYPRISIWETYDVKGEARNRLWTAWLDGSSSNLKGDEVKIIGELGTKVGIYNKPGQETKNVVEHSLNNCIVQLIRAAETKTAIEEVADILAPPEIKDLPF